LPRSENVTSTPSNCITICAFMRGPQRHMASTVPRSAECAPWFHRAGLESRTGRRLLESTARPWRARWGEGQSPQHPGHPHADSAPYPSRLKRLPQIGRKPCAPATRFGAATRAEPALGQRPTKQIFTPEEVEKTSAFRSSAFELRSLGGSLPAHKRRRTDFPGASLFA
jgi:hypothetical protein